MKEFNDIFFQRSLAGININFPRDKFSEESVDNGNAVFSIIITQKNFCLAVQPAKELKSKPVSYGKSLTADEMMETFKKVEW